MGLVSHLIGRWLRKRRVKKRKSALKDELEDLDLTANERGDLFAHVKYAAENGGGLGTKVMLGFLLVLGLGWVGFAFMVFEELVMLSLMSIPGLMFVGIVAYQYPKMRRANRITRLLKEQPRALLNVAPEQVGKGATQPRQGHSAGWQPQGQGTPQSQSRQAPQRRQTRGGQQPSAQREGWDQQRPQQQSRQPRQSPQQPQRAERAAGGGSQQAGESDAVYCPACGAENRASASFCSGCGTRF